MGILKRARRAFSREREGSQENIEKQHERAQRSAKSNASGLNLDEIKELMLTGPDTGVEIELRRIEAYIEGPTQKLLRNLLEKGKKAEILPSYDPSSGFRYRTVETAFDESIPQGEVEEFLERLNYLGILEKRFFDTVSACPICGSTSITIHYSCPNCTNHNVVKSSLIEHVPCGNIDEREKYDEGNSLPTCPKCGAKLVEDEYRDMGQWYICRECKEKFEHPNLDLVCFMCHNQFTIETAIVREISKYALNPDREQEIKQNVTSLESVTEILADLGFSVEPSATAIGEKSGIQHNFSLIAKKEIDEHENIVVVDHAVGDIEVSASPLILYTYKLSEVKADLPIFIAIPGLSETARKIAQGYNILVIEGIPQEKEQLAILQDEIKMRLSEKVVEEPEIKRERPPEVELVHQWIIRRNKRIEVWRDRKGRFKSNP